MSSVQEVLPEVPWLAKKLADPSVSSGWISRKLHLAGFEVGDRAIRHWRSEHSQDTDSSSSSSHSSLTTTVTSDGISFSGLESSSYEAIFKLNGLDPHEYRLINDKLVTKTWQVGDEWRHSYSGAFERIDDSAKERAEFLASTIPVCSVDSGEGGDWTIRRDSAGNIRRVSDIEVDRHVGSLVVNFADLQIGKVDVLGDTPALVTRFERLLNRIISIAEPDHPHEIIIAELGDVCENVNNHTSISQASSNDLPLAEQIRWGQRLITEAIISLEPYADRVTVVGVPSNHGAERLGNGKQNKHGDFGISNIRGIQDAFEIIGGHPKLRFHVPTSDYESGVLVKASGLHIIFTHGHYASTASKVPQWVANQAATPDSIYAQSKVVVHGHFHHFCASESRGRMILGCPTLDNGSSWFTQSDGEWSQPGVMLFRVTDGKFHGLQILN